MPIHWGLSLHTAPTSEPVTLAQAKLHIRHGLASTDTTENDFLNALITAARQYCERVTNLGLTSATWDLLLDDFPGDCESILLPRSPALSVSSIYYYNASDTNTLFASSAYILDTSSMPNRIYVDPDYDWPTSRSDRKGMVTIQYIAGYGSGSDDRLTIPKAITQAMLLLIGHWYANRESSIIGTITSDLTFAVDALLDAYRIPAMSEVIQ